MKQQCSRCSNITRLAEHILHIIIERDPKLYIPLRVQLGQFCCVGSYALHVIEHKVYLFQGRRHHIDKVITDGFYDNLCCLLLGEASSVEAEKKCSQINFVVNNNCMTFPKAQNEYIFYSPKTAYIC